ncbi:hypothetical protein BDP27DRAFT_1340506 [Rhodocollybia butyracea]|uniref:Erythromycin biosynthesis protein CIII-like C-terminal domain-containing protein n=1 Tax=Rhodocollybia butyracea TaxID=206335 RepID=A0A9P5PAL4_9AGAR|nr:hypothetical protein BDP27DRAFT_1340506 [Rhodocollybia butyracea]
MAQPRPNHRHDHGTHFEYTEGLITTVINGVFGGMSDDMQFLWKAPCRGFENLEEVLMASLPRRQERNRVRVVPWLDAAPSAILLHQNVVCYIHHGGANSYFEGARAGTPQIILPQWYDTYENASRVEYLGIGIYGNKTCAPDIDATELGVAVARVTGGEEGKRLRENAEEIRKCCGKREGREMAADVVLGWLDGDMKLCMGA